MPKPFQYSVTIDASRCTNCGLCVAFCPVEVLVDGIEGGTDMPTVKAPEKCWGCETCVGQCPQQAITVRIQAADGQPLSTEHQNLPAAPHQPLSQQRRQQLAEWEQTLTDILGLRWHPVAVSLISAGEKLPDVPVPSERLRYCQSLAAARRGRSLMMPVNYHACPDGAAILGLTELPAKLASGELYKLFQKLDSTAAAQRMVSERPMLPARSIIATVVAPLAEAAVEPQVIAVTGQPEQIMWLCMSATYYTGQRFEFKVSGYNALCVEATLIPLASSLPNISFGCYGCRAASDISDDQMFMGIPVDMLPTVIDGLRELAKKAIPQSRDKIYLPPL